MVSPWYSWKKKLNKKQKKRKLYIFLSINVKIDSYRNENGPFWSWLYGSWIYNYPWESVTITTKVLSSNPIHGEVYLIQHYVIKFVSDFLQVSSFLWVFRFLPPIKLTAQYNWNIVESCVKHHKPTNKNDFQLICIILIKAINQKIWGKLAMWWCLVYNTEGYFS